MFKIVFLLIIIVSVVIIFTPRIISITITTIATRGASIVGIFAAGIYSFLVTWVIVALLDKTIGFRVNDEEEEMGLDTTQHGETGYNMV